MKEQLLSETDADASDARLSKMKEIIEKTEQNIKVCKWNSHLFSKYE